MTISALIIDDNRRYTALLKERLEKCGFVFEHKLNSQTGKQHLLEGDSNRYQVIFTDITMESQVSGILLTHKIRRMGFKGCLVVYSTGFNTKIGLWASAALFKILGADGLIAKNGLKAGNPKMLKLSPNASLQKIEDALS